LPEGEHSLSLQDLLRNVLRYLWVLVLVAITVVGMAVGYTMLQTPVYEASIKILVGQEQGSSAPGSLGNDVMGLQQLTRTVAELVNDRPVAEEVVRRLGLPMTAGELAGNLEARPLGETQVIQVNYRDPSPQRAQQVADAVGEVFSEQISEVSPSANAVTATVWERAEVPAEPVSPNLKLNIAVALLIVLTLDLCLVVLLAYLDRSWIHKIGKGHREERAG
jgi:capsular polysaccharide biosynthesis protein